MIASLIHAASTLFPDVAEVCISDEFRASCSSDQVILVTSAEYGRMEVGRCIKKPDEFLGCTNDVLHILDRMCSGKQECNFLLTNDGDIEEANTNCQDFLMKYLRVESTCLKGMLFILNHAMSVAFSLSVFQVVLRKRAF